MTLEELKQAADEMGYSVVKKPQPTVKLLPCTCGRKQIDKWHGRSVAMGDYIVYKCYRCGNKAEPGKTIRAARLNWNKMIEELNEKSEG